MILTFLYKFTGHMSSNLFENLEKKERELIRVQEDLGKYKNIMNKNLQLEN